LKYLGVLQTPLTLVATRTFTRWPANAAPPVVTFGVLVLKPGAGVRPTALLTENANVVLLPTVA